MGSTPGPILAIGADLTELQKLRNEMQNILSGFRSDAAQTQQHVTDDEAKELRARRDQFRDLVASYRTSMASIYTDMQADRARFLSAQNDQDRTAAKKSIEIHKTALSESMGDVRTIQAQIGELSRKIPPLPLRVKLEGEGLEALTLIRDQFGALLGPLNGVTGRITSLIEIFKLLGKISTQAAAETAAATAAIAAKTLAAETMAAAGAAATAAGATAAGTALAAEGVAAAGATAAIAATAEVAATAGAATAVVAGSVAETTVGFAGLTAGVLATGIAISSGILALVGIAAGMVAAEQSTLELEHEYETLGKRIGATAKEIQGLTVVAAVAGVPLETMVFSLSRLSFALAGGRGGAGAGDGVDEALTRTQASVRLLVGNIKDASGQFLPPIEIFKKLADSFKNAPDGIDKTALAMQLFGRNGAQLIPILDKGSGSIQSFIDEANRLGIVLDGNTEKLSEYRKSTGDLGLAWESLKQSIASTELFDAVTASINKISAAIQYLVNVSTNADVRRVGSNIAAAITAKTTTQNVDELSKKGDAQKQALSDYIATETAAKSLGRTVDEIAYTQHQDRENRNNLEKEFGTQTEKVKAAVEKIKNDTAGIADLNARNAEITKQSAELGERLANQGVMQRGNAQEVNTAIGKSVEGTERLSIAGEGNVVAFEKFGKKVEEADKALDAVYAKYGVFGAKVDRSATSISSLHKDLEKIRTTLDAIHKTPVPTPDQPIGPFSKAQEQSKSADIALLQDQFKEKTKLLDQELAKNAALSKEEARRFEQIKKATSTLHDQAVEENRLAGAVGDNESANKAAMVVKAGDLELDKLRSMAKDKEGKDVKAVIDWINAHADAIRADVAAKIYDAEATKLIEAGANTTAKYKAEIDAIKQLNAAYADKSDSEIAAAARAKSLEKETSDLKELQDRYKDWVSQGRTDVTSLVLEIKKLTLQLNEHKEQVVDLKNIGLSAEINKQTLDFEQQLPALQALTRAYLQNSAAVREAEVQLQLLKFRQAEIAKGSDPDDAAFKAAMDKKLVLLRAVSDETHESQVAQAAGQYLVNKLIDENITKLQEARAVLVANNQSTLLIDAAIYDAQEKLNKQIDDAAIKVGSLKQKYLALLDEVVAAGKDFGAKVFGSISKAIDDLSTQLAHFVVTGKASFKALAQSFTESVVKAGIQKSFGDIAVKLIGKQSTLDGSSPQSAPWVKVVGMSATTGVVGTVAGLGGGSGSGSDSSGGGGLLGLIKGIFGGGSSSGGSSGGGLSGLLGGIKSIFTGRSSGSSGSSGATGGGQGPTQDLGGGVSAPGGQTVDISAPLGSSTDSAPKGSGASGDGVGSVIGAAGIGAGIGGAVGGSVGSAGGALAGATLQLMKMGVVSGPLAPILLGAAAVLVVIGILRKHAEAQTAALAADLSKEFNVIGEAYKAGNATLVDTLNQEEAQRAATVSQLSGRKGGQKQLDALLPQMDAQIAALKLQQKGILDAFDLDLGTLRFPEGIRATVKSLEDLNKQVKTFIDAGGSAAKAAEFFGRSLADIKAGLSTTILSAQKNTIGLLLQEIDLRKQISDQVTNQAKAETDIAKQIADQITSEAKQEADLRKQINDELKSEADKEQALLNQGVVSRERSVAQGQAAQLEALRTASADKVKGLNDQLATTQENGATTLKNLQDQQKSIVEQGAKSLANMQDQLLTLQAQVGDQQQLLGLGTDEVTLKAQQLAIEQQLSAQTSLQLKNEEDLLRVLSGLKPGATQADINDILQKVGGAVQIPGVVEAPTSGAGSAPPAVSPGGLTGIAANVAGPNEAQFKAIGASANHLVEAFNNGSASVTDTSNALKALVSQIPVGSAGSDQLLAQLNREITALNPVSLTPGNALPTDNSTSNTTAPAATGVSGDAVPGGYDYSQAQAPNTVAGAGPETPLISALQSASQLPAAAAQAVNTIAGALPGLSSTAPPPNTLPAIVGTGAIIDISQNSIASLAQAIKDAFSVILAPGAGLLKGAPGLVGIGPPQLPGSGGSGNIQIDSLIVQITGNAAMSSADLQASVRAGLQDAFAEMQSRRATVTQN